ncbi:MAG TPA: hypothetical protein VNZ26_15375 [Vicinamibacterales bacterium]|nr:hypothetical protein [Vicinamibacterales bacterium]
MACALYAGCKWLTYRQARTRGAVEGLRVLGYLLAWPGMDSTAFLRRTDRICRPDVSEWISAALKTGLGAALIAGTFILDMRPYLTSGYRRLGYQAINIVFAYPPVVYALAAAQPGWLK